MRRQELKSHARHTVGVVHPCPWPLRSPSLPPGTCQTRERTPPEWPGLVSDVLPGVETCVDIEVIQMGLQRQHGTCSLRDGVLTPPEPIPAGAAAPILHPPSPRCFSSAGLPGPSMVRAWAIHAIKARPRPFPTCLTFMPQSHFALGCRPGGWECRPLCTVRPRTVGAGPARFGCFPPLPSDPCLRLKPALLFQVSSRW